MVRWAEMLVDGQDTPWRTGAEPVNVTSLGAMLDSISRARVAPHRLSIDDLVALGSSTALAAWAGSSGAHHSAVRALRQASPDRLSELLAAVERDPAAASVMVDAAWECVEADDEGSGGLTNAEAVLARHGVSQNEIDIARVRHLPARSADSAARYDAATSRRVVTALLTTRGDLTTADWSNLAQVTWDRTLRDQYPSAWLQTALRDPHYTGPGLTDAEAEALPRAALISAMLGAVGAGVDPATSADGSLGCCHPDVGDAHACSCWPATYRGTA